MCGTVKIHFDDTGTSTCNKYSTNHTLRSVAMLPHAFRPPFLEILDSPLILSGKMTSWYPGAICEISQQMVPVVPTCVTGRLPLFQLCLDLYLRLIYLFKMAIYILKSRSTFSISYQSIASVASYTNYLIERIINPNILSYILPVVTDKWTCFHI